MSRRLFPYIILSCLFAQGALLSCSSPNDSTAELELDTTSLETLAPLVWKAPESSDFSGESPWNAGYVFNFQNRLASFYSIPWSSYAYSDGPILLNSEGGTQWNLAGSLSDPVTSDDSKRFGMQCNTHGCVSNLHWTTDLLHWQSLDTAQFRSAERVLATDSLFYRFHGAGSQMELWTSSDGGQWSRKGSFPSFDEWEPAFLSSSVMIIGNHYSRDCLQWDTIPLWIGDHQEIFGWISAYNGTYIAVYTSFGRYAGQRMCSSDLKSWKKCNQTTPWDSQLKYRWFRDLGDSLYWVVREEDIRLVDLRNQKIIPVPQTFSDTYLPARRGDTLWIAGTDGIHRYIRQ